MGVAFGVVVAAGALAVGQGAVPVLVDMEAVHGVGGEACNVSYDLDAVAVFAEPDDAVGGVAGGGVDHGDSIMDRVPLAAVVMAFGLLLARCAELVFFGAYLAFLGAYLACIGAFLSAFLGAYRAVLFGVFTHRGGYAVGAAPGHQGACQDWYQHQRSGNKSGRDL